MQAGTLARINDLLDYFEASESEVADAGDKLIELLRMARAAQSEASASFRKQLESVLRDKQSSDQRATLAEAELGKVQTDLAGNRAELAKALESIKNDQAALAAAKQSNEIARAEATAILVKHEREIAEITASRDSAIKDLESAQIEFDGAMEKVLERIGTLYGKFTEGNQDVMEVARGE